MAPNFPQVARRRVAVALRRRQAHLPRATFEALLAKIEPDLVGYYEETHRARVPLHRCSVTHAPTSIELQRPAGGLRRTAPLPGTARHSPRSLSRPLCLPAHCPAYHCGSLSIHMKHTTLHLLLKLDDISPLSTILNFIAPLVAPQ